MSISDWKQAIFVLKAPTDMVYNEIHAAYIGNYCLRGDKKLDKPRILSLFPNSFNKFIKHERSCKILYLL